MLFMSEVVYKVILFVFTLSSLADAHMITCYRSVANSRVTELMQSQTKWLRQWEMHLYHQLSTGKLLHKCAS